MVFHRFQGCRKTPCVLTLPAQREVPAAPKHIYVGAAGTANNTTQILSEMLHIYDLYDLALVALPRWDEEIFDWRIFHDKNETNLYLNLPSGSLTKQIKFQN